MSGRTLERIEEFIKITELVILRKEGDVEISFYCFPAALRTNESKEKIHGFSEKEKEKLTCEQFNLLINKGLMLSA